MHEEPQHAKRRRVPWSTFAGGACVALFVGAMFADVGACAADSTDRARASVCEPVIEALELAYNDPTYPNVRAVQDVVDQAELDAYEMGDDELGEVMGDYALSMRIAAGEYFAADVDGDASARRLAEVCE